jgi:hypothetical protein
MDPFQTLTATSSSSSPSLDDSSLQRSLQLDYHKSNDHAKHDIVVDLGAGYNDTNGGRRTISETKPHSHPNVSDMHRANRWKYTIFGLVRYHCNDELISFTCAQS